MKILVLWLLYLIPSFAFGQYYISDIAPDRLKEFNVDLAKSEADSLYAAGQYEKAAELYGILRDNWQSILNSSNPTKEQIQNYFYSEVIYLKTRFRIGYREESYRSLKSLERQIKRGLGDDHLFFGMYFHELGLMTFQYLGDAQQSYDQTYKAMIIRKQLLPEYKKDLGWSYNNLAIITRRLFGVDSSLIYQFKALESRKEMVPPDPAMLLVSYSNISQDYLITGDYKLEKEYLLKAQEAGLNLEADHPYNLMVMTNLAKVYYKESDFRNSLRLSKKALSLRKKNNVGEGVVKLRDNYQKIADNFLNLGYSDSSAMYLDTIISQMHKYNENYAITLLYTALAKTKDNHDEAIKILKEAIELCDIDSECNEIWVADIYHEIGKNYLKKNDPYQAIIFALKAKEIYDRVPDGNTPNHLKLYRTLSDISYHIDRKSEAVAYLESAIVLQENDTLVTSYWAIETKMMLAKLYSELGEYEKAENAFSNLFDEINYNSNVSKEIPRDAYRYLSLHYQNKGDQVSAIKAAEQSKSYRTNIVSDNILNGISAIRLFRAYQADGKDEMAKVEFIEACRLLGIQKWLDSDFKKPQLAPHKFISSIEHIIELYRNSGSYFFKSVNSQLELISTIISILDDCRNNYFHQSAEQELHDIETNFYDFVLAQLYVEYENSPSETILEVVLTIMEKSRSIGLKRISNRKDLLGDSKLPKYLIAEESRITFQTEKIFQEYSEQKISSDDSLLLSMTIQLEKLDQEKDALIRLLKNEYPKYYEGRYNNIVVDLDIVQSFARTQNIGFVNFYCSTDHIYSLLVLEEEVKFNRIEQKDIIKEVVDLKILLSDNRSSHNESEYESSKRYFIELASKVYESLLGRGMRGELPSELVVVADGELLNLPFEVLLTNVASSNSNYKSLPYLIRDKTITYNSSLTQYCSNEVNTIGQNYQGFAPVYNKSISDQSKPEIEFKIYPLKRNIEEIESCATLFSGRHFVGDQANVESFKNSLDSTDILHLAMHTYVDDRVPLNSYLNFTNIDSESEHKLFAHEIVEMDIDADLVVLSACETNVGSQINGEGIRGIARSFFIASCPNLIITNWLVDDNSSNVIIYDMLESIKSGLDPARSLRDAKLRFIASSSNVHAHPSYWAPYTYYGGLIHSKSKPLPNIKLIAALSFSCIVFLVLIFGRRLFN